MTKYFPLAMLLVCGCTNVENLGSAAHPIFGSPRWALTLGNVNDDDAVAIAFTPNGDVIAGGNFKGAVDFGTQTFVTAKHAGWVSNRSASDGSERWTVVVGTEASAQASVTDLGTTADGSVIVMGGFSGDLHLGDVILHGGTLTLGGDCFVAKYDGEGQLLWARQIGPDTVASCRDLAVAEDGRFAMVGTYQGTLHLPGKTSIAGDHDAFLMAFDPDGRIAFGATARNPGLVYGMDASAVAITSEGDVVMGGSIGFSMVFEGAILEPRARVSQYVARFSLDGHMFWAGVLGATDVEQVVGSMTVAPDGGVVISTTRRAKNSLANGVPGITTLDPNGRTTWDREAVSGSALVHSNAVLDDGTIVTAGSTFGFPIDFGTGRLHGCMYLAAHDAEGRALDAVAYVKDGGRVVARSLASGTGGSFAFAGMVDQPADFGTGSLRFAGGSDAMIVVYDTH